MIFKNQLSDIVQSYLHPIESQKEIRSLRWRVDKYTEAYSMQVDQINDLSDKHETLKGKHQTLKDTLHSAILEALLSNNDVSDVTFGSQTHTDQNGNVIKDAALVQAHDRGQVYFGHGSNKTDALINLYQKMNGALESDVQDS